jgi:hypothetical protein
LTAQQTPNAIFNMRTPLAFEADWLINSSAISFMQIRAAAISLPI